jgi:hypothetical protein
MTISNDFTISDINEVKLQVLELLKDNVEVSLKDALDYTQRIIDIIIDEDNRKRPFFDAGNRAVAGIVENDIEGVLKFLVNYADGKTWDKSVMEALRESNNAVELINKSFSYDTNGAYVDFIGVEVSDKLVIIEVNY